MGAHDRSEHPNVALARTNLGALLDEQGKLAESEEQLRIALALKLARISAASYEQAGPSQAERVKTVNAWIAEHD